MRFAVAMLTMTGRPLVWWEARELPQEYRDLPSIPHGCLTDAQRLLEGHPDLQAVIGFAFREGQGYAHVWAVDDDGVVDLSAQREGLPDGYLGVVVKPSELARLKGPLRGATLA